MTEAVIPQSEKTLVSIGISVFVFLGYILESLSHFDTAWRNFGVPAFTPFVTVACVTALSWYIHWREEFTDHWRLILSCVGLPGLLAGLQSISRVTG